jgi:hypothetical protein
MNRTSLICGMSKGGLPPRKDEIPDTELTEVKGRHLLARRNSTRSGDLLRIT